MKNLFILFLILSTGLLACSDETFTPKPRGYFVMDTPQHSYQIFKQAGYPYQFEYAKIAHITHDTSFFGSKPENPYWININYPEYDACIYLSYKKIDASHPFEKLLEDAHNMSFFHDIRADYINTPQFLNKYGVRGIFFSIGGNNAATPYQFFATDSVKHYFRGALYFNVTPNADSLKPISNFIKHDMEHLIETLQWQ